MNHLKNIGLWLLYFIPAILIELACYVLAPIVACFVTSEYRYDRVKRLNNINRNMPRDYLIKPLYWFQTHDNAVDEWWYGVYNTDHWFAFARNWTQADYDCSRLIRWYCRLMWLWRNCAYGFHYALFSRPKETVGKGWLLGNEDAGYWHLLQVFKSSFQLEMHVPHNPLRVIVVSICLIYVAYGQPSPLSVFMLSMFNLAFYKLIASRYLSVNIGWKAHKTTKRLLYANRIISFRKY